MTRLSMALTALDRLEDAKANDRPVDEITRLETAYDAAEAKAASERTAHRCMVERLPLTSWLAGHTRRDGTTRRR